MEALSLGQRKAVKRVQRGAIIFVATGVVCILVGTAMDTGLIFRVRWLTDGGLVALLISGGILTLLGFPIAFELWGGPIERNGEESKRCRTNEQQT